MSKRIGERPGWQKWVVRTGVALGAGVTLVAADAAYREGKPIAQFLTPASSSPRERKPQRIAPETLLSPEKLQKGLLIVAVGHSMLLSDGERNNETGTFQEGAIDHQIKQVLEERYPGIDVQHANYAIPGSSSKDLLHKLRTDQELRDQVMNFPGEVMLVMYTGENDWKGVLTSEKAMLHLDNLAHLKHRYRRRISRYYHTVRSGLPISHNHGKVERELFKTKAEIFREVKSMNRQRQIKGHNSLYIAALESADFSKASAITMWPPEGVIDVKPTKFLIDSEEARRGAQMVSESNTNSIYSATGRLRRWPWEHYINPRILHVSISGVEAHFPQEGDQHVGHKGQRHMAERVVGKAFRQQPPLVA